MVNFYLANLFILCFVYSANFERIHFFQFDRLEGSFPDISAHRLYNLEYINLFFVESEMQRNRHFVHNDNRTQNMKVENTHFFVGWMLE